jgi:hypothetical protein
MGGVRSVSAAGVLVGSAAATAVCEGRVELAGAGASGAAGVLSDDGDVLACVSCAAVGARWKRVKPSAAERSVAAATAATRPG